MEKNKLVRITRDYRLAVIAAVRSVALLCLLALAVFSVWRYRDDFNSASAKQLIAYVKSASYSDVTFEQYDLGSGLNTTCAPLGVGMAVVESDIYKYVAGDNRVEFSYQLKYQNPVIKAQDDWALIYDGGGTGYSVVTGYAVTRQAEASGAVITGAVSESGVYAVVCKSPGYRSSVTLYSKKHKQLCSWETPSEYIMMVSISPDGERFITVSISSDGEDMVYRIIGRNSETGEKIFDQYLDCARLYSLRHTADGNIMMLSDNAVTVMDYKGGIKARADGQDSEPLYFCHYEQEDCLVICQGEKINTVTAMVYDKNGDIIYSEEISGIPRACDCRGGSAAVLLDSALVWYRNGGTERIEGISARGVISLSSGVPVLIYSDKIERVTND
ncbi:MAG: hypothetical protein IJE90_08750 [Clostridia bacterium]|nr:hypothetical protein [Clostridia bacterium]